MRLLTVLAAAILFVAFGAVGARAADKPMTADQASRFVASLDSVEALAEKMRAEGKADQLKINTEPKAGAAFKPYSNAVTALKEKYPAEHARLADTVKPHGFGADEWGGVGDRVMVAYMALRMKEENPQGMAAFEAMDPSMLANMPPQVQAQFAAMKVVMEAVKQSSPEDQAAVASVRGELDKYMARHAGKTPGGAH